MCNFKDIKFIPEYLKNIMKLKNTTFSIKLSAYEISCYVYRHKFINLKWRYTTGNELIWAFNFCFCLSKCVQRRFLSKNINHGNNILLILGLEGFDFRKIIIWMSSLSQTPDDFQSTIDIVSKEGRWWIFVALVAKVSSSAKR